MKVLCDVCGKLEASVFCCADEAALCDDCDNRVHRANKLAGKHSRFSLLSPTSGEHFHPLCDICQKKRGFLFCQEDRAIMCQDCDVSIHSANHLTMKHNRFVLTGVRFSSSSTLFENKVAQPKPNIAPIPNQVKPTTYKKPVAVDSPTTTISTSTTYSNTTTNTSTNSSVSSISEYLTKTCPGWHMEDLLVEDDITATTLGTLDNFCEVDEFFPFLESNVSGDIGYDGLGLIVGSMQNKPEFALQESPAAGGHFSMSKSGRRERRREDVFMVPQVPSLALNPSKRSRHSLFY